MLFYSIIINSVSSVKNLCRLEKDQNKLLFLKGWWLQGKSKKN